MGGGKFGELSQKFAERLYKHYLAATMHCSNEKSCRFLSKAHIKIFPWAMPINPSLKLRITPTDITINDKIRYTEHSFFQISGYPANRSKLVLLVRGNMLDMRFTSKSLIPPYDL